MKPDSPVLAHAERLFADALLDLDCVPQALALFAGQDPASTQLEARLAFYRGNLSAIWTQALAGAYPVLQQLVGTDFFVQMARAYGRAFPSQSGDLHYFGADLPAFLAQASMTAAYPYFADVAALEWQVHRAYYAADADLLSLPLLLASAGQNLQQVRLNFHPAAQLHESPWASVAVWQAHQGNPAQALSVSIDARSYGLITRKEWQVSVQPLTRAAYLALQALQQGAALEQALELALDADADFDIAGQLNLWFLAGAFSGDAR